MSFEDDLQRRFDAAGAALEFESGSAAAVKDRARRLTRRRRTAVTLALVVPLLAVGGFALSQRPQPFDVVETADEPEVVSDDSGEVVTTTEPPDFCPPYGNSELHRARARSVTLSPDDDWEATLNNAEPDTDYLLTPGVYRLAGYSVFLDKPDITIRGIGADRDAVVIEGQGYDTPGEGLMIAASGITIADLSVTGIRDNAVSIKSEFDVDALYLYNLHLYDNGMQHVRSSTGGSLADGVLACSSLGYSDDGVQGDVIGGVHLRQASNWIIRDNLIYNVTGDGSGCAVDTECGTHVGGPAILVFDGSRNAVIERNTIVDTWRGITLGQGDARHDGATVRNNFLYRPEAGDAGIELFDAHDVAVEHNTVLVAGYQGAIEYGGSSGITLRNNLISAPIWNRTERGESTEVTDVGNITDGAVGDLAVPGEPGLAARSRAVGAGEPSPLEHDIEGDPRNGRWDVGADQTTDP